MKYSNKVYTYITVSCLSCWALVIITIIELCCGIAKHNTIIGKLARILT